MKKNIFYKIGCVSLLCILSLVGCNKQETNEISNTLSYADMVDNTIMNETQDEYFSANNETSGEHSIMNNTNANLGTIDYSKLTDEEIAKILKQNAEDKMEESGSFVEFSNGQTAAQGEALDIVQNEKLKLAASYLMINVFAKDYVVDTTMDASTIENKLLINKDSYIEAFAQEKSNDDLTYFALFLVDTKENVDIITNNLLSNVENHKDNTLMTNSIIANKQIVDDVGNERYIVLFASLDFSNREEPLVIPNGYALVEEKEDGSYILEGKDDAGNIIHYNGQRLIMSVDYKGEILKKLSLIKYNVVNTNSEQTQESDIQENNQNIENE